MPQFIRQFIKGGVPVHLVVSGVEKRFRVFGGSVDMDRFDDPNADALIPAGIHVAGIFERHLRIGGVEAANMLMAQPLFGADKYFPKWPVCHFFAVDEG